MAVQNDRMLFFDFVLPGYEEIDGYRVRFHVYTLSGNVTRPAAWKMVLKGVDGVVFVADSGEKAAAANGESLAILRELLQGFGKTLEETPCVIQCNKRDLAAALPLDEIGRALGAGAVPLLGATARKGEGVLESLNRLVRKVAAEVRGSGLEPAAESALPAGTTSTASLMFTLDTNQGKRGAAAGQTWREVQETAAPSRDEPAEPVIEFAGSPELLGGGRIRLPLRVRWGGEEKKMAIAIALEQDES